jgi:hypothetical protein
MLFTLKIMNNVGLIGGCFQHAYSSTWWKKPSRFTWNKGNVCDITCFMENEIVPNIDKHTNVKKIAWVVESSAIISPIIDNVVQHAKEISESYEFLISHDRRIYSLAPNFYYLPPHGYWIEKPDLYPKSKLCSMISSNKLMCNGHNFRLSWVNKLMGKLDMFGRGINTFDKKEEALCDYLFSVTIENDQYETYWTEKILDCFVCGTIPVYHGSPDIAKYFNPDGMITLTDQFDVSNLSPELYLSKEAAIRDNFERAVKYNVIEDIMWDEFISKL